jgi:Ca2+-binding RTX toxin-like protein
MSPSENLSTDKSDTMNGNGGHDLLLGQAGNDTLEAGPGVDRLHGGDGDDDVHGGAHDHEKRSVGPLSGSAGVDGSNLLPP